MSDHAEKVAIEKPKALVIDDDDGQLRANKLVLGRLGFNVISLDAGGDKGIGHHTASVTDLNDLEKIVSVHGPFQMVMTDYDMPNFKGTDVIKCLRGLDAHHHLPAMLLTGNDSDAVDADLEGLKQVKKLIKPASMQNITEAINELFGQGKTGAMR